MANFRWSLVIWLICHKHPLSLVLKSFKPYAQDHFELSSFQLKQMRVWKKFSDKKTGVERFRLSECFPATPAIVRKVLKNRGAVPAAAVIERHDANVRTNWQQILDGSLQVEPDLMKHLVGFLFSLDFFFKENFFGKIFSRSSLCMKLQEKHFLKNQANGTSLN